MEGLQYITAMEIAISICTNPYIKDITFKLLFRFKGPLLTYDEEENFILKRFKEVEEATFKFLKHYSYPSVLAEKICSLVLLISTKLLRWAHYNYREFDIPYEFTRNVVNRSLFNQQGTIDYKTGINGLIRNRRINRFERSKMYCNFYFGTSSMNFYNGLCRKLDGELLSDENEDLVNLHALLKQQVDFLNSAMTWKLYFVFILQPKITDGNYILFRHFPVSYMMENRTKISSSILKSVAEKCSLTPVIWEQRFVPKDFYMNLFLDVFEELDEYEKTKIFKISKAEHCYGVLKGLLDWPFQIHFLRYAQLMRRILRVEDFARLLIKIISKNKDYEGRIYNYRCIFQQFWLTAPEKYKRFVCREKYKSEFYITSIFNQFIEIDPFTHFDRYNFKLVFQHAKKVNDSNMIFNLLKNVTQKLATNEKYKLAEIFFECIFLPKQTIDFKNKFLVSLEGENSLKELLTENRLKEADFLIRWCLSPENSSEFKVTFLHLRTIIDFITGLVRDGSTKLVDNILEWGFTTSNEMNEYKISLLGS